MTTTAGDRCPWCGDDPRYVAYHDEEWGVPCRDEAQLFELLVLEGMQAGLSWRTILHKRDAFRRAFHAFDPARIARYGEADRQRLLQDRTIVRNRAKIDATIGNARALLGLRERGGSLGAVLWDAVEGRPVQGRFRTLAEIPARTPASEALSGRLRELKFRFVGPTIVLALMQAAGLVNHHLLGCPRHEACAALAEA